MLILTPPPSEKSWIFQNIFDHSVGRLFSFDDRKTPAIPAQTYFKRAYQTQNLSDLVDGHRDWYLTPLELLIDRAPALFADPQGCAVDLGTGSGAVCTWLYQNGWQGKTLGIDFIEQAAKAHTNIHPNHTFLAADLAQLEKLTLPKSITLFVAINTLVYLPKNKVLLETLGTLLEPEGRLMIIEPTPSPFWRPSTKVFIRPPRFWQKALTTTGWEIEETVITAWSRVGKIPLFPITQAYLCRRAAPQR